MLFATSIKWSLRTPLATIFTVVESRCTNKQRILNIVVNDAKLIRKEL